MNAYMAYKVSTRVCRRYSIESQLYILFVSYSLCRGFYLLQSFPKNVLEKCHLSFFTFSAPVLSWLFFILLAPSLSPPLSLSPSLFLPIYLCLPLHQTSLPMFRSRAFSVRRRFSDFLGLYEKLSVKQSLNGCIIPPPPEKSVVGVFITSWQCEQYNIIGFVINLVYISIWNVSLCCNICYFNCTGMTKVKVGKEDPSSAEFVERRRAALER